MSYSVKETFLTVQGEGAQAGRPAVFLRFAGCNLWSGREQDRAKAVCDFCDTDFVGMDGPGGGRFKTPEALAGHVRGFWPDVRAGRPLVVCTGGEPLLQLDASLIDALHQAGFEIAVETNGTIAAPEGIDWITVSPKGTATVVQRSGDELKLVFPQAGLDPQNYTGWKFKRFSLQPMDGDRMMENARAAFEYCLAHPQWSLSLQTHKWIGAP
ncbi:7-carboxy-7-deazaguanine synthase [Maricaulis sp.]|uniref:7-carboxy-7-deazaguanine synthase n=1 Tax=Maricaulis sp. TaxID=1486257 RepID=UPI00260935F3|nr:7-carboxy-7-deazaguanine synthase [Maricaulis sp.]